MARKPVLRANLDEGQINDRHMAVLDAYEKQGFLGRSEACRKAGYKDFENAATYIFKLPHVKADLEKRRKRTRQRYELEPNWIIQRLMNIVDGDAASVLMKLKANGYDLSCLTLNERYMVDSFQEEVYLEGRGDAAREVKRVKIGISDRTSAATVLARSLGMLKDKVEVAGEVSLVQRLQAARQRNQTAS